MPSKQNLYIPFRTDNRYCSIYKTTTTANRLHYPIIWYHTHQTKYQSPLYGCIAAIATHILLLRCVHDYFTMASKLLAVIDFSVYIIIC